MLDAHLLLCFSGMEAWKELRQLGYRRKTARNKDSSKPITSQVNLYRAVFRIAASLAESIPVYLQEDSLLLNSQQNNLLKKLKICSLFNS